MLRTRSRWIALSALMACSGLPLNGAILIDDYSPDLHNRFSNHVDFIADGYDLSGLARSAGNKWGTLIRSNIFLSAEHWHPETGDTLSFYATNDQAGDFLTARVVAGQRIGATDIWIGVLARNLPQAYQPMTVHDEPISSQSDFSAASINEADVFLVGRSDNVGSSVTNVALGRNRIDYWYDAYTDGPTTDVAIAAVRERDGFPRADDGYVPYEAFLQIYDSGAPVLMDSGAGLSVIGINWFIDSETVQIGNRQRERELSGFSYVGNHAAEIGTLSDLFAVDVTDGYLAELEHAFPVDGPLAEKAPLADFDGDGLSNLFEYAYCHDPASGGSRPRFQPVPLAEGVDAFLGLTMTVRADPGLVFLARFGGSLGAMSEVNLTFAGSAGWESSDPELLRIVSAVDEGSGKWTLEIREGTPLQKDVPRFLQPGVRTEAP